MNVQVFYENRANTIIERESKVGKSVYAAQFGISHTLPQFVKDFQHLKNGEKLETQEVCVAGT